MGVDPYSFVSALNGILAQRLVRVVCTQCAETVDAAAELLDESGIRWPCSVVPLSGRARLRTLSRQRLPGRKAIAEMLVLNDEMREAIVARVPVRQLKELACKSGLRLMRMSPWIWSAGRNHTRGGQSCHRYGVTRSAFS